MTSLVGHIHELWLSGASEASSYYGIHIGNPTPRIQ